MSEIMNFYCEVSFAVPAVLVVEPSEDNWKDILRVSTEIIDALPGRVRRLYFLGRNERYPVRTQGDIRKGGPGWIKENAGRPLLINPVLEDLGGEDFNGVILLLSSKLPIDLDDWEDTDIIERIIFIDMGSGEIYGKYNVVNLSDVSVQIPSLVKNDPLEVFVSGDGFAPVCYSIESCKSSSVLFEEGKFVIKIEPSSENLKIHLAAICDDNSYPELNIKRQKSFKIEKIAFKPENPWFKEKWNKIPDNLRSIIRSCISSEHFICPQCKRKHESDTLTCPEGGPILRGLPVGGCLIFSEDEYFFLMESSSYPLGNSRLLTGNGKIYKLNDECLWEYLKDLEPYERVDDGLWGLLYRI